MRTLAERVAALGGATVQVSLDETYPPEHGQALLEFSDGSRLSAAYWRLIENGQAKVSCFDHLQQYGLPERIDAIHVLRAALANRTRQKMTLDTGTGDLSLIFDDGVQVQVFRFTFYEVWEMTFPDGSAEYSNFMPPRGRDS